MENAQIKEKVNKAIESWIDLQKKHYVDITITPKAIDFVVELIANIENDPSKYWKSVDPYEDRQKHAISLIPNALNDVISSPFLRYKIRRFPYDIEISTWELWRPLSNILLNFCFIPLDDDDN